MIVYIVQCTQHCFTLNQTNRLQVNRRHPYKCRCRLLTNRKILTTHESKTKQKDNTSSTIIKASARNSRKGSRRSLQQNKKNKRIASISNIQQPKTEAAIVKLFFQHRMSADQILNPSQYSINSNNSG